MRNPILLLLLILSLGCTSEETTIPSLLLSDTTQTAVTPLTGFTSTNEPFIWWVEKTSSGENIVYFSTSADNGNTFERAQAISVSKGCNDGHGQGMPKVIYKKDGTMIVVYNKRFPTKANRFAGKIFYAQSFDNGKTWTEPSLLHHDTIPDNGHAFPAVTLLGNGEVAAAWLDGRNKLSHSQIFISTTDGKSGFTNEKIIGGPACQCCKLDFYTDTKNHVHLLYRGMTSDNIRDIVHIRSTDNGLNFSTPERISKDDWKIDGCPHQGPCMVFNNDSLHYVWFTMGTGEGIFCCSSDPSGTIFSSKKNLGNGEARYPTIASVENNLVIAWQESPSGAKDTKSRIKVQVRTGDKLETFYATPETENAYHPALHPLKDGYYLLCYEKELIKGKTAIVYQRLKITS